MSRPEAQDPFCLSTPADHMKLAFGWILTVLSFAITHVERWEICKEASGSTEPYRVINARV